ncbi:MAG: hypothetical protein R3325_15760, partial [Thermoanaerobaculia bacterium]|nr:hypothetical protein [Thermoanaerobaculia bacterium]
MPNPRQLARTGLALAALAALPAVASATDFVNFETPHVHPLDLSPDRATLAAVNTADNSLELFDVADGTPRSLGSVSVGLDPVTARFRSSREVWVVNQISDSVSVVDVPTRRVRATLATDDEPADVVFAGSPERAFVSCSQPSSVLVFDPERLDRRPRRIEVEAEEPRAMAVGADGGTVFVALFESGNRSTVLAGGFDVDQIDDTPTVPPNVVSDPEGPYGGVNPPPNRGGVFEPPLSAALPPPPPVSLIVKRDAGARWMDDNGGDWTDFVSGARAGRSGRRPGWEVVDRDVAVIDAATLEVGYLEGLLNAVMAIAVQPRSGRVTAVGTDATNEVRFEPLLNGRFLRVNLARAGAAGPAEVLDLNPHLTYETPRVPAAMRKRSLGDPRAIVWSAAGDRGFVAGMGSNNVVE